MSSLASRSAQEVLDVATSRSTSLPRACTFRLRWYHPRSPPPTSTIIQLIANSCRAGSGQLHRAIFRQEVDPLLPASHHIREIAAGTQRAQRDHVLQLPRIRQSDRRVGE